MPVPVPKWVKKTAYRFLRSESRSLRQLVLCNCVRLDGQLSRLRMKREIRSLLRFVCLLLAAPTVFLFINIGALVCIHHYIVPIPMAMNILGAFHPDPDQWEHNIEHANLGDVGEKYEAWSREKGFSETTSRFWQENLWNGWLFYILSGLYLFISFYTCVIKFCLTRYQHYRRRVIERHEAYYDYDLQTIPREKIIY